MNDLELSGAAADAIYRGEFTLSSGERSDWYFDARRLMARPASALAVGRRVAAEARRMGAVAIGGPALGAVPVVCAAVVASEIDGAGLDGFFARESRKAHGRGLAIEGALPEPGAEVLIVEDVITTGASALRAIHATEELGCRVLGVMCVLDRQSGGGDAIRARGYDVLSIWTAADLAVELDPVVS